MSHIEDRNKRPEPSTGIGPALIGLIGVVAAALISATAAIFIAVFHHDAPTVPTSPATTTQVNPSTIGSQSQPPYSPSASSSHTPSSPVDYSGSARIAYGEYFTFDASPPGPASDSGGPGEIIFNASGPGVPVPRSLSMLNGAYVSTYPGGKPSPTKHQCEIWAQTHADTQTSTLSIGDQLCFTSAQHKTIYGKVTKIESSPDGTSGAITLAVIVWSL